MSSKSTIEGETPHFAYLVLRVFPPFPTKIVVLWHHATSNDIFLPCGCVGPIPITRVNKVEIFVVGTLVLHIGSRLPSDLSSTMYLYWEQIVTENHHGIKYSLYVADVSFRDFIKSLRNVGGAMHLFLILNSKRNYSN